MPACARRVEGLCALSLAVGSATGAVGFYGILVVAALLGGTRAFEFPAMSALLPSLLAPAVLPAALALSSSAITSAQIVGPALGGLLYAAGPAVVYAGCGALFFAASVASATIVAERRVLPAPAARGTVFDGIRYVRSKPAILGSLSLDLFAVLLGGATALLPVYARDILSVGTVGLGGVACGAGGWRAADLGRAVAAEAAAGGAGDVRRGGAVRRRDDRVRRLALDAAVAGGTVRARRGGRGLGRGALLAGAAADAGRDARPGECGQRAVHRHVQPARRVRERG